MSKTFKLTQERYDELVEEYNYLKNVREKEVADLIKEARSFGDLSENSEYDEAKNEQGKLFSRKAELENIIQNAEIIAVSAKTDEVHAGSRVRVCDLSDNTEEEYWIVGSQEANPYESRVSDESPLGSALMGSHVGDVVKVHAPMGVIEYKILEIGQ